MNLNQRSGDNNSSSVLKSSAPRSRNKPNTSRRPSVSTSFAIPHSRSKKGSLLDEKKPNAGKSLSKRSDEPVIFERVLERNDRFYRVWLSFHAGALPITDEWRRIWIDFVRSDASQTQRTIERFGRESWWHEMSYSLTQIVCVCHLFEPTKLDSNDRLYERMTCKLAIFVDNPDSHGDPFAGWTRVDSPETDLETWFRRSQVKPDSEDCGLKAGLPGSLNLIGKPVSCFRSIWTDAAARYSANPNGDFDMSRSRKTAKPQALAPDQMTMETGPDNVVVLSKRYKSVKSRLSTEEILRRLSETRPVQEPVVIPLCGHERSREISSNCRRAFIASQLRINAFGFYLQGKAAQTSESSILEAAEARMSLPESSDEVWVASQWKQKFPKVHKPTGENGRQILKLWREYVSCCWCFRAAHWLEVAREHPKLRKWKARFSSDLVQVWFSKSSEEWHAVRPRHPEDLIGFYHFLHFFDPRDPLFSSSSSSCASRDDEVGRDWDDDRFVEMAWNSWSSLISGAECLAPNLLGTTVSLPDAQLHPRVSKNGVVREQLLQSQGYWSYLDECMRHALGILNPSTNATSSSLSRQETVSKERSPKQAEEKSFKTMLSVCELLNRLWDSSLEPQPILARLNAIPSDAMEPSAMVWENDSLNTSTSQSRGVPLPSAKPFLNPNQLRDLALDWDASGRTLEKLLRNSDRSQPGLEPVLVSANAWKVVSPDVFDDSIRVFCEFDMQEYLLPHQYDEDSVWQCWVNLSLIQPNSEWVRCLVERGFDLPKALKFVAAVQKEPSWIEYEEFESAVDDARGEGAPELTDTQLGDIYDHWFDHLPARPINLTGIEPPP